MREIRDRAAEVIANNHTHLIARVARYDLAIPIGVVISIHEAPLVFPVPCAQPGIAGAVQFQGLAVPVFDLRRSLRLESRAPKESDRLIFVDAGMRIMALIVDEVLEFAAIDEITEGGADALFGDTPVNTKIIAGIACAPKLCAVIDPKGLLQPDSWDAQTVQDVYEQRIDETDPLWARTVALAEMPKAPTAIGTDVALFQLGTQRFGVQLPLVVEFFTGASHSPIPVRTNIAVSLLNLRGEGIMLFDPKPILGLPSSPLPKKVDGVVLSGERCLVALPVDKLEGLTVLTHSDSSIRPGRFCLSVHPTVQGSILLLDVPAFLHHAQSAFGTHPKADAVA